MKLKELQFYEHGGMHDVEIAMSLSLLYWSPIWNMWWIVRFRNVQCSETQHVQKRFSKSRAKSNSENNLTFQKMTKSNFINCSGKYCGTMNLWDRWGVLQVIQIYRSNKLRQRKIESVDESRRCINQSSCTIQFTETFGKSEFDGIFDPHFLKQSLVLLLNLSDQLHCLNLLF